MLSCGMPGDGRVMAILVRFAAILCMLPVLAAQATAACSCNCGGAVAGSIVGTLALVVIVLVILWFCCLRGKWLKRHGPGVITTHPITDSDLIQVDIEEREKVDAGVTADLVEKIEKPESANETQLQIWGIPSVMRKFMDQCEIPHESVVPVKLDNSLQNPEFSIAQHGVALFVKETKEKSKLSHLMHINEGMHIIGMSVVFNNWNPKEAAQFIAAAASYKSQLYVRKDPLFDVDELPGCAVTKSELTEPVIPTKIPSVDEATQHTFSPINLVPTVHLEIGSDTEPELVVAEKAGKAAHSAPRLRIQSEAESIAVSDDEPILLSASHSDWPYERNEDNQKDRIFSIERPPPPPPRSVSETTSRESSPSWGDHIPLGGGSTGDVYRATPVYLEEGDFGPRSFEEIWAKPPKDFVDNTELQSKVPEMMSQPALILDVRGDPPRDASSLDSLAVDSGLGSSANIGFNGFHSLSDVSQDGRTSLGNHLDLSGLSPSAEMHIHGRPKWKDTRLAPDEAVYIPEMSDVSSSTVSRSSSVLSSVAEAPIERNEDSRKTAAAPKSGLEQEHLHELSELDRKIALNNIEIATLMLNDSQDRLSFSTHLARGSESEGEEANEEVILATSREDVQQPRSIRLSSLDDMVIKNAAILSSTRHGYSNDLSIEIDPGDLAEVDDDDLSNVIDRLAQSSDSEESIQFHQVHDLQYEPNEAYA